MRIFRNRKKVTQKEVSIATHISLPTISKIELAKAQTNINILTILANFFEVKIDDFFKQSPPVF